MSPHRSPTAPLAQNDDKQYARMRRKRKERNRIRRRIARTQRQRTLRSGGKA